MSVGHSHLATMLHSSQILLYCVLTILTFKTHNSKIPIPMHREEHLFIKTMNVKSGCFIAKSMMGWLYNTITARPEPILLFGSSIASEGSNRRQIDKQNKHYSCLVILKTFVAALMRKLLMLPAPHSNRPTWVFTASCCVICHNNLIVLLAPSSIHNTMESMRSWTVAYD